jgi:hypothetical protein
MPLPVIVVTGTLPAWESPQYSWLLKANKLLKPYSFDELLGLVKNVLKASVSTRNDITPPPTWLISPRADRFRL